ncbi:MAG: PD-(D/E)XK nuclease family protein [Clostridia bacterium]|nr:PD-(D/E)XK nuclease family protein [Clostridia bacterium]
MLRIFEGGFTSPMHDEVIKEIRAAMERSGQVYLIVPEQDTVRAEVEMSELLPPSAPLSFEVTNFTRFTNTAFRAIGGISGEYCRGAAKTLFMWRTLAELAPKLHMMRGRRSVRVGAVRRAMAALSELGALGISPEMLAEAAGAQIGDNRLKEKLSDLSLIYTLFTELIGGGYKNNEGDAEALARMLREDASFLLDTEIFIEGFTSFTEPQHALISLIMEKIPLTVALTHDRTHGGFEFSETARTRSRLMQSADGAGVEKKLKKFAEVRGTRESVLSEVRDLLWHSDGCIDNDSLQYLDDNGGRLRIFSAETVYEECALVAADVKRRIMAGERYSDLAIVMRRAEDYAGILEVALDEAGIPHFISRVQDLSSIPLMKMISTAYKIVATGYRREDVLTYLKCGLSGIGRDDADVFELYVEKWGIDRRRFTDGIDWNMNPRGYEQPNAEDAELLIRIADVRERLISPLCELELKLKDASTVKEHAIALLDFLTSFELEERMAKRAEAERASGDGESADLTARAWGILCDALDVLVEVVGDMAASPEGFLDQLNAVLAESAVGRIPSFSDAITVGCADMLRVRDKKHVYLLGVNAGKFPASVDDSSYFGEGERTMLSMLGLPFTPELEMRSARELYSFSRAFSIGRESVTILYAEKTPMLSPLNPSEVIGRIGEITRERVLPVRASSLPLTDMLYSPMATLDKLGELGEADGEAARQALLDAGYGELVAVSDGSIRNDKLTLDGDSLAMLYKNDLYLSETKISKFLGCPMSYFCKYNLHLGENEPAELGSNVIGSFVHGVIEGFFRELERRGADAALLSESDRGEITERAAESYAKALLGGSDAGARTRIAISRLARATRPVVDGLCEELAGCGYKPTFFELKTDGADPNAPEHLVIKRDGGGRIILRGTIDRVDTFKSGEDVYVRIVDYKTGSIDFLPSKLKAGENLQMFLYLKAVSDTRREGFLDALGVGEGGRVIPAGVIYVKTKVNDTTVRHPSDEEAIGAVKELYQREGMLLDDEVSLSAMNPDYIPKEEKRKESLRYTSEGWAEIERTLIEVTRSVADDMTSGDLRATPATKGGRNCKWCRYKEICRSAVIKNDFN